MTHLLPCTSYKSPWPTLGHVVLLLLLLHLPTCFALQLLLLHIWYCAVLQCMSSAVVATLVGTTVTVAKDFSLHDRLSTCTAP